MKRYKRNVGFALIELMIVVAIIGILAFIAFPSYQDSVRKARREDGYNTLNEIMQAQERFFANNIPHTYTVDLTQLGFANAASRRSVDGHYDVSAAACPAPAAALNQCVMLTAVARLDQVRDVKGANGPNLVLTSQGVRTPNAPGWWGQ